MIQIGDTIVSRDLFEHHFYCHLEKCEGNCCVFGDSGAPLEEMGREECAYVFFEDGIARCAIEKAYEEGSIPFRKPVSCHLYPIRINRLKNGVALNYHQWSICEPARILGKLKGIPVFRFLKDALTRVYGPAFYDEMEAVYQELIKT
jgi:hypothetical protein